MEAQNATGQIGQTIGLVILRKRVRNMGNYNLHLDSSRHSKEKRQLKVLDLEGSEWTILFALLLLVQTHRYGRDTEMWMCVPIRLWSPRSRISSSNDVLR